MMTILAPASQAPRTGPGLFAADQTQPRPAVVFGIMLTRNSESFYTSAMSSPLLFTIASLIWGSTFWAITLQLGEVPPAVSVA
jgi:hypothetical protein